MLYFRLGGLDDDLAVTLYELDRDPANHLYYPDVAEVLDQLHHEGVRIAVVSDIHFDLRPEFEAAMLARYVDTFVLSFEHGVQKPDQEIFQIALDALDVAPGDALMVGDRASRDGGALAVGIPTLLLPPLPSAESSRGLGVLLGMLS
jgi:HAD superfamily hydrolase (TIGR01509 family)